MGFVKDILRGVAIGIANVIPGVSGGTMMVSMGIYNDVISAVTGIFTHMKKSIRTLLPYAIGMMLGIAGLSFIIGYFFGNFPFQTAMLFIGLIFGGLPLILHKVQGGKPSLAETVLFVVFFALIIWMQFWESGADKVLTFRLETVVSLFLIGTVAAATMVIPGVSGSMILMSLGYYEPIIEHINLFVVSLMTFNMEDILTCLGILVPFGIGVALGIFLISKLVEYLLLKQERKTYFAILGLVVSSPIAVLAGIGPGSLSTMTLLSGILLFGAGFVASGILGK